MTPETIFTNAVLVLPDAVVIGTLVIRGGSIAEIESGYIAFPGGDRS